MARRLSALVFLGAPVRSWPGARVGPAYKKPDIALPTQWHESATAAEGGDGNGSVGDRGRLGLARGADWWRGFGSAKLDELIAEAERNNDDLAAAPSQRVQEAERTGADRRCRPVALAGCGRPRPPSEARTGLGVWVRVYSMSSIQS